MKAKKVDVNFLNDLYKDRTVFFGEMHDHANTGGTSDGQKTLSHWIGALEALKMDFAAILDHRQVRHMYLPEWQDGLFIGASEAGTHISNPIAATKDGLHYNCVFAKPEPFMEVLNMFEEFQFEGGSEGHFKYPHFTRERFSQVINAIKEKGGMFVHAHPKQVMVSEEPLDYWFVDYTGIEVFYVDLRHKYSQENYKLWTDLLALGKKLWACAGGDGHACCSNTALTTIYAESRTNEAYLTHYTKGDFTCGSVGIKMCIGETKMGGECEFNGKKLIVCVNDFHPSIVISDHKYKMVLINDKGVVCKRRLSLEKPNYFTFKIDNNSKFYRVEVFDESYKLRIAIGNPIWNK